jgi:hypothetical protein
MEANFQLDPKNPEVAAWQARADAEALGLDPDIAEARARERQRAVEAALQVLAKT